MIAHEVFAALNLSLPPNGWPIIVSQLYDSGHISKNI